MKNNRRAQAAMEFLMTYGWAILVVLVAIGALAYFGVFDPGRWLPVKCDFGAGFSCEEYQLSAITTTNYNGYNLRINIVNGLGKAISLQNSGQIQVQSADGSSCTAIITNNFPQIVAPLTLAGGYDSAANSILNDNAATPNAFPGAPNGYWPAVAAANDGKLLGGVAGALCWDTNDNAVCDGGENSLIGALPASYTSDAGRLTRQASLEAGQSGIYAWSCTPAPTVAGARYKAKITFSYTESGSTLVHPIKGDLVVKAE